MVLTPCGTVPTVPVRTDLQFLTVKNGGMRGLEIARRVKKSALFWDWELIHGDPATNNSKGMLGLNLRIQGKQLLSMGTNGGQLTLDKVDELLDSVYGLPGDKFLVMNKATRRKLKKLVLAEAGGAAVGNVGSTLPEYDGTPIELMDEDGDEQPILDFNEKQGNDTETTSMSCLNAGGTEDMAGMKGLAGQGLDRGELLKIHEAGVQGRYWLDVLDARYGFAIFNPRSVARLKGIKKPA